MSKVVWSAESGWTNDGPEARVVLERGRIAVSPVTWSHEEHTDDCMSDWSEARRGGMTSDTVAANHRLHMGDVERAE